MQINMVRLKTLMCRFEEFATNVQKKTGNSKENQMKKYVCNVCGYVYDPAENDNVAFEDLADDYVCPLCGVGKEDFSAE